MRERFILAFNKASDTQFSELSPLMRRAIEVALAQVEDELLEVEEAAGFGEEEKK